MNTKYSIYLIYSLNMHLELTLDLKEINSTKE